MAGCLVDKASDKSELQNLPSVAFPIFLFLYICEAPLTVYFPLQSFCSQCTHKFPPLLHIPVQGSAFINFPNFLPVTSLLLGLHELLHFASSSEAKASRVIIFKFPVTSGTREPRRPNAGRVPCSRLAGQHSIICACVNIHSPHPIQYLMTTALATQQRHSEVGLKGKAQLQSD